MDFPGGPPWPWCKPSRCCRSCSTSCTSSTIVLFYFCKGRALIIIEIFENIKTKPDRTGPHSTNLITILRWNFNAIVRYRGEAQAPHAWSIFLYWRKQQIAASWCGAAVVSLAGRVEICGVDDGGLVLVFVGMCLKLLLVASWLSACGAV